MVAVPSEALRAEPELLTMPSPLAVWVSVALLTESLPVAWLSPGLGQAEPEVGGGAEDREITGDPSPSIMAPWVMTVLESLPMARALPEPTSAVPSDWLPASPELLATWMPRPTGVDLDRGRLGGRGRVLRGVPDGAC